MKLTRGGVLFSGDWQTTWTNVPKVEQYTAWLLEKATRLQASQIVLMGDMKEHLNPIDVRVAKAVRKSLEDLNTPFVQPLIVLLGNHDRNGMQDDSGDWFSILQTGGVRLISEPDAFQQGEFRFCCVPYYSNPATSRAGFDKVAKLASREDSILLFHNTLNGTRLNHARVADDAVLVPGDLHPEKYIACFGGHIHLRQQLPPNIEFVGSPFAQDWGECNQDKGALYLDLDHQIHFLKGPVPGYYDPKLPGFTVPETWAGAHVRIQAPQEKKQEALAKAQRRYKGAYLHFKPTAPARVEVETGLLRGSSDTELVYEFVARHAPAELQPRCSELVAYILHRLSQVPNNTATAGFKILRASGENVLGFRKLDIDYTKPGLELVSGLNKDWDNGSNGSGKTSYLQPPALALFGKTLKGQENDDWLRRKWKKGEPCFIKLDISLSDGRLCTVTRWRKPKPELLLMVDGVNLSTGFGKNDTQKRIEQLLGITWEGFRNALYIDQLEANVLLTGTEGTRRALFTQLLNLGRFTAAQKLVAKELSRYRVALDRVPEEQEHLEARLASVRQHLSTLRELANFDASDKLSKVIAEAQELKEASVPLAKKLAKSSRTIVALRDAIVKADREFYSAKSAWIDARHAQEELSKAKVCPTCGQALPKNTSREDSARKAEARTRAAFEAAAKKEQAQRRVQEELDDAEERHNKRRRVFDAAAALLNELLQQRQALEKEAAAAAKVAQRMADLKSNLQALRQQQRLVKQYRADLEGEVAFLKFADSVLNRNGVPAYLVSAICPQLQHASDFYSELFCENNITVDFLTDGPELDVCVTNVSGGAKTKDQSCGELRMASLITSFSVREVLARYNLLIADEPGNGLDERKSLQFAKGLRQVAARFGRVQITSHNPFLLAELSDATQTLIIKRDGNSKVKVTQ